MGLETDVWGMLQGYVGVQLRGDSQKTPKKGITPTFLFFSDGIGTQKILFDQEGSGFLGMGTQISSSNNSQKSARNRGARLSVTEAPPQAEVDFLG